MNISDNVEKKKKGRPKKVIGDLDSEYVNQEKKKRGRKKKEPEVENVKIKKKRGRKASVKYFSSSIRKQIPLTTGIQDSNYILHLDVKQENTNKENIGEVKCMNEEEIFQMIKDESKSKTEMLQEEYNELLKTKENLVSNIINDTGDISDTDNINELYDKYIELREEQDKSIENDQVNYITEEVSKLSMECETESRELDRKKGFFTLNDEFIENKEWLEKTDTACWWCCHKFNSVPIGLPVYYNKVQNKYRVYGVFCSFPCVTAYDISKNSTYKYLILDLYILLTGEKRKLLPAPPKEVLKMFGGKLSIEEFRNATETGKIYKMIEYPMFVFSVFVEEIDVKNMIKSNQNNYTEKTSTEQNKMFSEAKSRLEKANNTTITSENTIEKFISFF